MNQGLRRLPEPKNEFEIEVPDIAMEEKEDPENQYIEMEEIIEKRKQKQREEEERELKKRSQVIQ